MGSNSILPPSKAGPVEIGKDCSLLHRRVLCDSTDMLHESMTRLGLRGHRQHHLIESVHQAVHLTQQQRADAATPRTCPDAGACPEKPSIIFLVWCAGAAKRGSDGARDFVALHRHPTAELDHRIDRLEFLPDLGVIEDGLVGPELARDAASRLVKRRPQL